VSGRSLDDYQAILQGLLNGLGREDIGVGEVVEADGRLEFTLVKGDYSHRDHIALDVLDDRERALGALMAVIPNLSKPVEKAHIEAAHRSG
jgi:hypothetical protein